MDLFQTTSAAAVLAALRPYLLRTCGTDLFISPPLLEIGGILRPSQEDHASRLPVIGFDLRDNEDRFHRCLCNPAGFALLLLIIVCGQSVFIDRTNERLYVKVFGKRSKSAGTILARLFAEAGAEEEYTYRNSNRLDLTFENIAYKRQNPRTTNELEDSYSEIVFAATVAPDDVFPGSAEDKAREATRLLHLALHRVAEERDAAVKA